MGHGTPLVIIALRLRHLLIIVLVVLLIVFLHLVPILLLLLVLLLLLLVPLRITVPLLIPHLLLLIPHLILLPHLFPTPLGKVFGIVEVNALGVVEVLVFTSATLSANLTVTRLDPLGEVLGVVEVLVLLSSPERERYMQYTIPSAVLIPKSKFNSARTFVRQIPSASPRSIHPVFSESQSPNLVYVVARD